MASARLRVFSPVADEPIEEFRAPSVAIPLADLYPLLSRALRDNYTWLKDFDQDEVMVSGDLYEVIRAFADIRPSA